MRVANIITHLYLTLLQDFLRYFHVIVKETTAPFISFHSSFFFSLHIHLVFFYIIRSFSLLSFSVTVHSFKLSSIFLHPRSPFSYRKGNTGIPCE